MDKNKLAENYCTEKNNKKINIDDIKSAFIAGCNSVIEENSHLEWIDIQLYRANGLYVDVCKTHKPLKDYLIRQWSQIKPFELYITDENTVVRDFKTIEDAKKYAIEDYKNTLTNFLGL